MTVPKVTPQATQGQPEQPPEDKDMGTTSSSNSEKAVFNPYSKEELAKEKARHMQAKQERFRAQQERIRALNKQHRREFQERKRQEAIKKKLAQEAVKAAQKRRVFYIV